MHTINTKVLGQLWSGEDGMGERRLLAEVLGAICNLTVSALSNTSMRGAWASRRPSWRRARTSSPYATPCRSTRRPLTCSSKPSCRRSQHRVRESGASLPSQPESPRPAADSSPEWRTELNGGGASDILAQKAILSRQRNKG